jgi:hypothetical protein
MHIALRPFLRLEYIFHAPKHPEGHDHEKNRREEVGFEKTAIHRKSAISREKLPFALRSLKPR